MSFRKAYGVLKDSTQVGLANLNSEFKDLDIAIVKATNHVELPPKERHVRKILFATSSVRPRADVAYCIHTLSKRLAKTKSWIVALKVLLVIHRTLREGDPTFREELLNYSHRGHVLQISNFKDDSSPLAWDCSAWVRTYALFLEERLECFRVLKYDNETDRLSRNSPASAKVHSRTRVLNGDQLLLQLPALQQLLYRLIGCQPEGAAYCNHLIQYALALVLKESFKIYCAVNDGIINLVDVFFDMPKHDAVMALNIYKRAGQQAENLAELYDHCRRLEMARNFQFPMLRQPPPSFLQTMEEYIKEAPQLGLVQQHRLEFHEPHHLSDEEEQDDPQESKRRGKDREDELIRNEEEENKDPPPNPVPIPVPAEENRGDDLLGLGTEINPIARELEDSNALALAIVPNGNNDQASSFGDPRMVDDSSGWELALVSTPSNINNTDSKLGGGFNKLLLDSLYEDDAARRHLQLQNAGYGHGHGYEMCALNPFEQQQQQHHDPFMMSNSFAPPTNVQMALAEQQHQHLMYHPQQDTMTYQSPQHMQPTSSNPFGDSFSFPHTPQHGNTARLL